MLFLLFLGSPKGAGAQPPDTSLPFYNVQRFYRAVGENDWEEAQKYVTPALWSYLKASGFLTSWGERKKEDPSLDFVFFLVREQGVEVEKGAAWGLGEVYWTSQKQAIPPTTQTVFLVRTGKGWKIKEIRARTAAEVADEFYAAINAADWERLRSLTLPDYWKRLAAAGVLNALARERGKVKEEVYVIFHIRDFAEAGEEAWVRGEAIWLPLKREQRETPVTLYLRRAGEDWLVAKVVGHWERAK